MKKIDVGQVVGILANLGVIAGIIFLAIELHQNNQLLEAEARLVQSDRRIETFNDMIRNPEFAEAVTKVRNGESLTPREELQLEAFAARQFRSWEWQYRESQLGALADPPASEWRAALTGQGAIRSLELHRYWNSAKPVLDPAFVEWMEKNVVVQ